MRKLFSLFMALLATTSLWAEDFSVGGIYYNYLDGNNVEVTYRGSRSSDYSNEYTGTIVIPATVYIYGTTYNVTSIGDEAFEYCSSLTSVTIPNSVTSIGKWAFDGCSSLTSITIPESVTTIELRAFYNCTSLQSITIPENVTSIGGGAFLFCSSLNSVVWNAKNCVIDGGSDLCLFYYCYSDFSGTYISICPITSFIFGNEVEYIPEHLCSCLDKLTSITIPNSVTNIGNYAFSSCSSLTSVTIPNSVTSIGESAFYGCSSLTSVTIGNSVTSIGDEAFERCTSLTSIVVETGNTTYDSRDNCNAIIETATNTLVIGCKNTIIPNSVTSIGEGAFRDCSSLTSITIPNSVTSIGDDAFRYCSSLTSVTIGNSVTSIGYGAFRYCSSLTSITLPNSVTSIGYGAFEGCTSLTSITIPESVTTIEFSTFCNCTSLTSITLPNSVTSIGNSAFYNCTSIQSITCKSETPPTIYNSTFENVSTSIPLYVPCGTVDTYNASTWNYFSNIQELLSEYAIVVSSIDNKQGSAKLDKNSACGSVISAIANTGYHFTQWSDGNLDNPRTFIPTQDTTFIAEFAPDRHTISAYTSDSERGTVSGGSTADYGSYVTITATANYGYHFTCWDDGNTDNPRRIQVVLS